jgi:hypothetical protein
VTCGAREMSGISSRTLIRAIHDDRMVVMRTTVPSYYEVITDRMGMLAFWHVAALHRIRHARLETTGM